MASPSTWDPWREMHRLQREMERMFADASPMRRWPLGAEFPPINVTRTETGITLEALCPGVDRATLDVSVVGDAVTIRGERKPDPGVNDGQYHRRERVLGAFNRAIALGERLDGERTAATYTNGILRVQLASHPDTTPRKVPIQA
jgi:HSP20 family protein